MATRILSAVRRFEFGLSPAFAIVVITASKIQITHSMRVQQ
jgi:hypothetical protein